MNEEKNSQRGIVPLSTITEAIKDMRAYAREISEGVLVVETEFEGKRYKGILYPVKEKEQEA